jgi:hypothetical protein
VFGWFKKKRDQEPASAVTAAAAEKGPASALAGPTASGSATASGSTAATPATSAPTAATSTAATVATSSAGPGLAGPNAGATTVAVAPPREIPRDKIMARAYEIWVRKGKPHGKDFENWIEAEAELRAELAANPDGEPLPRKSR